MRRGGLGVISKLRYYVARRKWRTHCTCKLSSRCAMCVFSSQVANGVEAAI